MAGTETQSHIGRVAALLAVATGVIILVTLEMAGVLWILRLAGVYSSDVALPILLVTGVVGLLTAAGAVAAVYDHFGLADASQALGMPKGSIQALIALVVLLMFSIMSLYLYATVGGTAREDLAKQIVTTIGTLVAAVSAFYFGARSVETGAAAAQAAAALATGQTPAAVTSVVRDVQATSATLTGTVNPRGLTTTSHFEYGTDTSYGTPTPPQTASGTSDQEVTAPVTELSPATTYHYRLVAENSAGRTVGADRTFTTAAG